MPQPSSQQPDGPAHHLLGLELPNGWRVVECTSASGGRSGGSFSLGYTVENRQGNRGFLKAIDYSEALKASDPARALQPLVDAFNFERDLLERCKSHRLSRVVVAIDSGTLTVPGFPIGTVQYIIFEPAEGDVRIHMDAGRRFDLAWAMRALHQVANGLRQLHQLGVAHQDLKPANVLLFDGRTSTKVADLGRAAAQGQKSPFEDLDVAGDHAYAPPEVLYGSPSQDWQVRRLGCDLYHLGSMVVFFFSSIAMTPLLLSRLEEPLWPQNWKGPYSEVLPYVRNAFGEALTAFESVAPREFHKELVTIVKQLCDPEPQRRGHPKNHRSIGSSYSLERYVSQLDLLARRAEAGLVKRLGAA